MTPRGLVIGAIYMTMTVAVMLLFYIAWLL